MRDDGWSWTSWEGRAVAWLTLRGRRWSLAALVLVVAAWGAGQAARVWGERTRAAMGTLPSTAWNRGGAARFVHWNVAESREMDAQEVREAQLAGRHVGAVELFVFVSERPVEWWGRVVGARGESDLRASFRGTGVVEQKELLRIVRWQSTVEQLIASSGMHTGTKLRAASAAGPATATVLSPRLVGLTLVERGSPWVMGACGCWLLVASYGELRRAGAMRSYRERGMCWRCGYELGVAHPERCPECGARLSGYAAQE